MEQMFGNYQEHQAQNGEYLKIGFHPNSIPLQQRWRNNGLSADFLAGYLSTFFPGDDEAAIDRKTELKDAVSYIANELLENAMKYSYASSHHSVSIEMFLEADSVSLYTMNSVAPDAVAPFQAFIERLLSEDLDELFTKQLECNAEDTTDSASGLGFLTMLNDYGTSMGWKFADHNADGDDIAVTTMVRLPI